jgi:hypothetical protein
MAEALVTVKLNFPHASNNAGETCGFPRDVADQLIADGKAAELVDRSSAMKVAAELVVKEKPVKPESQKAKPPAAAEVQTEKKE